VAVAGLKLRHGTVFQSYEAPFYVFIPCSVANDLGSWFQMKMYGGMSFQLGRIVADFKVISVMLVGKFLLGICYGREMYFEAVLLTVGAVVFAFFKDPTANCLGTLKQSLYSLPFAAYS